MSGADVPYHLRPHKAVDRRLFLDLLARCDRWRAIEDYAYISMGAYPMEDHKLIFRELGIWRLISFDLNPEIKKRQEFNKPIHKCICLLMKSGDMVSNVEATLAKAGYDDAEGVILWLDYTNAWELQVQLREFQEAIGHASPGDIIRITLNCDPKNLSRRKETGDSKLVGDALMDYRLSELRKRIGDLLPTQVDRSMMTEERFPLALSLAAKTAASKALPPQCREVFSPLSIVTYKDGQQMLTVTGVKVLASEEVEMRKKIAISDWSFGSSSWNDFHRLSVVDLTTRERLFLERAILTDPESVIANQMGFDFGSAADAPEFLSSFKRYSRFYPTYINGDV